MFLTVMERPMSRNACLIIIAAVCCLPAACAGSKQTAKNGVLSSHTIVVDGLERDYLLYEPESTSSARDDRALILVFHGGGGTARGIAKEVGRSLHPIADREGFIIVYPDAVDRIWDFGSGLISESLDVRVDDRSFFADLLDELLDTKSIDEHRVFATGISRGGQASYFVACTFPNRIRAIAPVAMPMPVFMLDICPDASGIGVAVLNGTDDPLVPYDGGQIKVGRRERGEVMSTDDTIDFWRARNDCTAEPTAKAILDPQDDRMQVHVTSWEQCARDPVLLYRIEGGGHTWPSGRQYLPRFLVGPVNRDIDAAAEIWAFFSRF
jgi:polyhydroxybutyrate depolymerase